jgi:ribosome biogenesis protein BRX1
VRAVRRSGLWHGRADGRARPNPTVHVVPELNLDRRRALSARNLLVFDRAFESSAELRVMKALLTRTFSVPASGPPGRHPKTQHSLSFGWLDGRIWLRVYRIM